MRITGGIWRSRRLRGPSKGMPLRPTPDALRERAFAVFGDDVEESRWLDLFAGTGAVGFEALSRGAGKVVFVERHRAAVRLIERNRDSLDVPESWARIITDDAVRAIRRLAREGETFNLGWADPPFERWELGLEALELAADLGVLEPGATACLECPSGSVPESPFLSQVRDLSGGASRLIIFRVSGRIRAPGNDGNVGPQRGYTSGR
ncbi:MAG: 16S rRNA (guanine(966)-N(2))-methyltransferase RsmD [Acidobacteria bacterium]|nr:16S rRNA (guanine(966)-N(2))-methyltransferase RsmD [Acidobacteriota bacterium]